MSYLHIFIFSFLTELEKENTGFSVIKVINVHLNVVSNRMLHMD